jgi:hypothetical protein
MSPSSIYWLVKLDDVRALLQGFAIGFISMGAVMLLASIIAFSVIKGEGYDPKTPQKFFVPASVLVLFSLLLFAAYTLLPSTKQMATIVVVPRVVSAIESNKELMSLPGEVTSLASAWIKELRPENIKEGAKTVNQQTKECNAHK